MSGADRRAAARRAHEQHTRDLNANLARTRSAARQRDQQARGGGSGDACAMEMSLLALIALAWLRKVKP
jgi:ribosome-interacting GTPase 1